MAVTQKVFRSKKGYPWVVPKVPALLHATSGKC